MSHLFPLPKSLSTNMASGSCGKSTSPLSVSAGEKPCRHPAEKVETQRNSRNKGTAETHRNSRNTKEQHKYQRTAEVAGIPRNSRNTKEQQEHLGTVGIAGTPRNSRNSRNA